MSLNSAWDPQAVGGEEVVLAEVAVHAEDLADGAAEVGGAEDGGRADEVAGARRPGGMRAVTEMWWLG